MESPSHPHPDMFGADGPDVPDPGGDPARRSGNGLGVAILVLGIINLVTWGTAVRTDVGSHFSIMVLAVPTVVLGRLALRRIAAGEADSRVPATVGLVLGCLTLGYGFAMVVPALVSM